MKGTYKITLFILSVVFFAACSRKKNTFLNRNVQAVSTEFNTLYNGDLAFTDGKDQLASGFRDNFWEILPVERIEVEEADAETKAPGSTSKKGEFNRAEEKAAKAIQKHSMYIDGKEPIKENEIAVSKLNADEMGKQAGDNTILRFNGIEKTFFISGVYQDVTSGGMTAKSKYNFEDVKAEKYQFIINLNDEVDIEEKASEWSSEMGTGYDIRPMEEALNQFLFHDNLK